MTDTDSLFYKIDTRDFYEDMKANGDKYGMSNFNCDLIIASGPMISPCSY
jgi:hypothetical protein